MMPHSDKFGKVDGAVPSAVVRCRIRSGDGARSAPSTSKAAFVLTLVLGGFLHAQPITLENDIYRVSLDPAAGTFSIQAKASKKTFVTDGKLTEAGGNAKMVELRDDKLGRGTSVEISHPSGNRDTIALYPSVPFVLFRSSLHNGGSEPLVLNRISGVSGTVNLGKPVAELRTLGTGGLLEPEKNPGSYAFLTTVDPATRNGVVGGWLTHDRGSGVVFSPVQDGALRIEAKLEYGRLRVHPGKDADTEIFAIGYFDDARFGLEAYADAMAKVYQVKLPPEPAGYCTWYMEKHAGACDEAHLAELSSYATKELAPFGFNFVQIDDGWQEGVKKNGPKKNFTTHAPAGPYPNGMKAPAAQIKGLGLTPGIWFMPFAGTHFDPYFQDHPDWFAKDPDGRPFETAWGGTCLDMTHPGAREHLRGIVQKIAQDWGYTLFKMDGLWTGTATRQIYVNDGYRDDAIGEATFSNPDKTNIEAYRDGLKLVRQAAGSSVFLLGCCVSQNMRSFGGSLGLLDAMRIGPDTGAGHIGAPHASRLWFLNGRVWWNDPDCVSVRAATPLDQARLNATFTAVAGDLFYNSDWMPDLPPERLDILRRCMPTHGLPSRPVDVFESQPARIWLLSDTRKVPRRDVVALYNWDKQSVLVECLASRIGLPASSEYVAFDFWANKFVPPFRDSVRAELAPGSCRVLGVRPVANHPQLLSTSRHVTQGIVDVAEEKWSSPILSGVSQVVANDPYELRIVVSVGEQSWRATGAGVSPEDTAAGVKTAFHQDGPKLRATLTSPVSRAVRWEITFERAHIEPVAPQPVTELNASADYRTVTLTWTEQGAEGYRIVRDDGARSESMSSGFTDSTAPHGKTCRYRVTALGWGGMESNPATVEVTTPEELKRPPVPPIPTTHLSDLKFQVKQIGWGKPGVDESVEGKPLTVDGKAYSKGLGLHARALVLCPIPAGAHRFVAVAGLDDEKKSDPRSSVAFEVYGDVKEMGEAPVLLAQSPSLSSATLRSWTFNVELNARFKELRLVVTDAGDGIASDHADWVDAGFIQ